MNISKLQCCGVSEVADIAEVKPEYILNQICHERFINHSKGAYYIFTEICEMDEGYNLMLAIKKHNLGQVMCTGRKINPNSGNAVRLWCWTVSNSNLKTWWLQNKDKLPPPEGSEKEEKEFEWQL